MTTPIARSLATDALLVSDTQQMSDNLLHAAVHRTVHRRRLSHVATHRAATAAATHHTTLGGVWLELRVCESGDDYGENSGNGYYGAYQFSLRSWTAVGYSGLPSSATPAVQDAAAQELRTRAGWRSWPACSYRLGLR